MTADESVNDSFKNGPNDPLVFISAKSEDYQYAEELYEFLRENNVNVFFGHKSLPELGNSDYRKVIDRMLDLAEHMIVVTSSRENVEASWVEAEWGFFISEKRSGCKSGNILTITTGSLQAQSLPPSLRCYEVILFGEEGFGKMLKYVSPKADEKPFLSKSKPQFSDTPSNEKQESKPKAQVEGHEATASVSKKRRSALYVAFGAMALIVVLTGIWISIGIISKHSINAEGSPFAVYTDGGSEDNHFMPSGIMGDLKSLSIQGDHQVDPHSGKSCIKITYSPTTSNSWAGIYWQYPINNWGEHPGYNVSRDLVKLRFWTRGEKGGEKAEFKVGGINRFPYNNPKLPYKDSFGPLSTGTVELSKEWQGYEISLKGQDLSNVIGGFCWVTNMLENPKGCIIYLDDITFVPK